MKTSLVRWLLGGLLLGSTPWLGNIALAADQTGSPQSGVGGIPQVNTTPGNPTTITQRRSSQVVAVTGKATWHLPGVTQPQEIKAGTTIPAGATIETDSDSSVDLFLGRNTGVLKLAANTSLNIKTLNAVDTGSETVTTTELVLQKGQVLGNITKSSKASSFTLAMPDGVLALDYSQSGNGEGGQFSALNRGAITGTQIPTSQIVVALGNPTFSSGGNVAQLSRETSLPALVDALRIVCRDLSIANAENLASSLAAENPTQEQGTQQKTQTPAQAIEVAARTVIPQLQDVPLSPTIGGP